MVHWHNGRKKTKDNYNGLDIKMISVTGIRSDHHLLLMKLRNLEGGERLKVKKLIKQNRI